MGSSQRKDGAITKAFELLYRGVRGSDAQIILEGNQDYMWRFFFEEVTKATFLSGVLITHNYDQDQLSWFSELNLFTTCKVVYPAGIAI